VSSAKVVSNAQVIESGALKQKIDPSWDRKIIQIRAIPSEWSIFLA